MHRRPYITTVVFLLVGWLGVTTTSWGQTADRIGTVLAVEGTAEVQSQNATTWEVVRFRDAIYLNDTVRTADNGQVKVLLRDDTILTLAERSEMRFTEFLLTQNQRRTLVDLAVGKLRVLTTTIFGSGSAVEIRTPNTVAGVRGTIFVVIFTPPDITEVISFDREVSARHLNPAIPEIEVLPANFRTRIIGSRPPERPTELSPGERQSLERDMRTTEQVPTEVKPTDQRGDGRSARGEGTLTAATSAPLQVGTLATVASTSPVATLAPPPVDATPGADFGTLTPLGTQGLLGSQELITPDTSPAAQPTIQESLLRLIIIIPR
jgi:hypothetical protein